MKILSRSLAGMLLASASLVASAPPLQAQEPAAPELQGVVVRGDSGPLPGAMVVLHRVDMVEAGEIDSLRAGPDGRFRFHLPTVPDPGGRGEVYFASVSHHGILYFGMPLTTGMELDSLYRIQVFDTTTAPPEGAPIPVAVRYLLVEEAEAGWEVTDLLELEVEGNRTWVAPEGGVTWRYPLPGGIRDLRIGGGDVAPAATTVEDGILTIAGPLSPGPRQVVLRYTLDSLSMTVPLPGGVEEMDLLIREPAPPVRVLGLTPTEAVEMEPGVSYRRYAGVALGESAIRVEAGEEGFTLPTAWLAVLLGLVLAGVGVYAVRRGGGEAGAPAPGDGRGPGSGPGPGPGAPADREKRARLILEVARLDQALETAEGGERDRLAARRAELLAALRESS